jgi:disintegrin and metalloproteinase domain-containing protein 10
MEHTQNCKNWFELKTDLGKNYTVDKFDSEGRPNICGTRGATKPELALLNTHANCTCFSLVSLCNYPMLSLGLLLALVNERAVTGCTIYRGTCCVSDDELAEVRGLVTEDGLFDGTISTRLEDFYIEPVSRYIGQNASGPHFHTIVYRSSDVYSPQLSQPCASQLLHVNNNAPREINEDSTASIRRKGRNLEGCEIECSGDNWTADISEGRTITIENKRTPGKGFESDVVESAEGKLVSEINENGPENKSSKVNHIKGLVDKEYRISKVNRLYEINYEESENRRVTNAAKFYGKSNKVIGPVFDAVSRSHRKNRRKRWPGDEVQLPADSSYTSTPLPRHPSRLDTYYYDPNVFYDFPNVSLPSTVSPDEAISVRHVNKRATVDPKKTTCMLYLQADHLFYQKYGTEEACIEVMTRHVQRVNSIYKTTGKSQ